MGWLLLAALGAHVGAHVVLFVGLGQRTSWRRAAVALVVPPLAPLWAWQAGQRIPVYVWTVALAAYALGVAVS